MLPCARDDTRSSAGQNVHVLIAMQLADTAAAQGPECGCHKFATGPADAAAASTGSKLTWTGRAAGMLRWPKALVLPCK